MEWIIRKADAGIYAERGARHDGGEPGPYGTGYTMPAFIVYDSARFDTVQAAEKYIDAYKLAEDINEYFCDMDPFGFYDAIDEYYCGDRKAAVKHDAQEIQAGDVDGIAAWLIGNVSDENAGADDRARAAELLARLFKLAALKTA